MLDGWIARLAEVVFSGGRILIGAAVAVVGRMARAAADSLGPSTPSDSNGNASEATTSASNGASRGASPAHRVSGAIALEADAVRQASRAAWSSSRRPPISAQSPAGPDEEPVVSPTLPRGPKTDRLVVMPRDPETLFAYWEVRPQTREAAQAALGAPLDAGACEALSIRVLSAQAAPSRSSDEPLMVDLPPRASSRYVDGVPAGERLEVTLGLRFEDRFVPLVPPAQVSTPPAEPSSDRHAVWRRLGADLRPLTGPVDPPARSLPPHEIDLESLDLGVGFSSSAGYSSSSFGSSSSARSASSRGTSRAVRRR